jgi:Ca2+/Na+ antiporter
MPMNDTSILGLDPITVLIAGIVAMFALWVLDIYLDCNNLKKQRRFLRTLYLLILAAFVLLSLSGCNIQSLNSYNWERISLFVLILAVGILYLAAMFTCFVFLSNMVIETNKETRSMSKKLSEGKKSGY